MIVLRILQFDYKHIVVIHGIRYLGQQFHFPIGIGNAVLLEKMLYAFLRIFAHIRIVCLLSIFRNRYFHRFYTPSDSIFSYAMRRDQSQTNSERVREHIMCLRAIMPNAIAENTTNAAMIFCTHAEYPSIENAKLMSTGYATNGQIKLHCTTLKFFEK